MLLRNEKPKGGTELQYSYLEKYVDKKLLDQIQIYNICTRKNTITSYKDEYSLAKKFLRST